MKRKIVSLTIYPSIFLEDKKDIISMKMLADVLQKVATRVNYGIQLPNANPKVKYTLQKRSKK